MTSNEIPVHIALGSNLGNPENFLEEAREALRKLPLKKMKCSSILKSSPLLGMAQPDYLNQLVCGITQLKAEESVSYTHLTLPTKA